MGYTSRMTYGPRGSVNSAAMTGTYQAIGLPFSNAAAIVKIVNDSDELVDVSIDGTTDHDVVPGSSFFLYDITSDSPGGTPEFLPQGTQFFVKGTAGTGLVYLVYMYPIQS